MVYKYIIYIYSTCKYIYIYIKYLDVHQLMLFLWLKAAVIGPEVASTLIVFVCDISRVGRCKSTHAAPTSDEYSADCELRTSLHRWTGRLLPIYASNGVQSKYGEQERTCARWLKVTVLNLPMAKAEQWLMRLQCVFYVVSIKLSHEMYWHGSLIFILYSIATQNFGRIHNFLITWIYFYILYSLQGSI